MYRHAMIKRVAFGNVAVDIYDAGLSSFTWHYLLANHLVMICSSFAGGALSQPLPQPCLTASKAAGCSAASTLSIANAQ